MANVETVRALAIADILDHDEHLLDEFEGHLLVAAGRSRHITPAAIARETDLAREAASDLFRQLEEAGAVSRERYDSPVIDTSFRIDPAASREILEGTRRSIQTVAAYMDRVSHPEVTLLVTFPEDPAFEGITPASFGMAQLMSTLASEVKRADDSIILLAPFFEGGGLAHLEDVLLDALKRDVELTIVTRYLEDSGSHNYAVISSFVDRARDAGMGSQVDLHDYTVWDSSIPASERTQDGENPEFTLHAKVMLFDQQAAYVGSANVTDYGFDRYLELGVLLRGPPVSRLVNFTEFLLDAEAVTSVSL